jgi:hypothetical protein
MTLPPSPPPLPRHLPAILRTNCSHRLPVTRQRSRHLPPSTSINVHAYSCNCVVFQTLAAQHAAALDEAVKRADQKHAAVVDRLNAEVIGLSFTTHCVATCAFEL